MRPFLLLLVLLAADARAENWSVEAFTGDAYNFRGTVDVHQDGGFSESVRADYETRGLQSPLYYMLRAGRWVEQRGWEVALLHHKLYVTNPPAGVENLSISHGFNILAVNRAFREGNWTWRLGAGPVITHAEAVIRGTEYHGPYRLSGVAVIAGLGHRFYLGRDPYLALEGALSAAYAKPALSGSPGGELTVRNAALHGLFGLGHDF
jgi:hypothetical protein